jgi:hypothetical protein
MDNTGFHSKTSRLAVGPTQPSVQWAPEALSSGVKWLKCEVHVMMCVAVPLLSHLFSWPGRGGPCRLFYLFFPVCFNLLCFVEFCNLSMFYAIMILIFVWSWGVCSQIIMKRNGFLTYLLFEWDLRFSQWSLWRLLSTGLWHMYLDFYPAYERSICCFADVQNITCQKPYLHGGHCFVVNVCVFISVDCTASIFHLHQIQLS